ncbi:MAG: hypothetical protein ACE15F_01350 [bacterium]
MTKNHFRLRVVYPEPEQWRAWCIAYFPAYLGHLEMIFETPWTFQR